MLLIDRRYMHCIKWIFSSLLCRPPVLALLILAAPPVTATNPVGTTQTKQQVMEQSVRINNETELGVYVYPAAGDISLVWVAPNYGLQSRHRHVATQLAKRGIEVWQLDLVDALFLIKSSNSMRQLDGSHVASIIDHVHHTSGKSVILMSSYYGAIPTLRGARAWQQQHPGQTGLRGVMLFSPSLYHAVPHLGTEPEFVTIAQQTNLPVFIFQPQNNPNRWFVEQTADQLRLGGADVFLHLMPGVTSLYYSADEAAATLRKLKTIPNDIHNAATLLARLPTPSHASTTDAVAAPVARKNGLNSGLVAFSGNPRPPAITLQDVTGREYRLDDYRGKVRLINFWATWCPPCVKEIPSLNALQKAMAGKEFEVISVNFAEDPQQVSAFLQRFKVDFPVLLDRNGEVSAQWRVFAFPSTFVVDAQGQIRYGVNAAIHWDSTEVITQLNHLLPKNPSVTH